VSEPEEEVSEPEPIDYSILPYEPSYRLREMRVFTAEWGSGYRMVSGVNEYHTKQKTGKVIAEGRVMLETIIDPTSDTKTVIKLLRAIADRLETENWDEFINVD
jgi:hypothetical protein